MTAAAPLPGLGEVVFVGTGFSLVTQTTPEALAAMQRADKLFHVVAEPAAAVWMNSLNPSAESLAVHYREGKPRRETYREIVDSVLAHVRLGKKVCVALYGHPTVGCDPTQMLLAHGREEGFAVRILPGISSDACLYADLGIDPMERRDPGLRGQPVRAEAPAHRYAHADPVVADRLHRRIQHQVLWTSQQTRCRGSRSPPDGLLRERSQGRALPGVLVSVHPFDDHLDRRPLVTRSRDCGGRHAFRSSTRTGRESQNNPIRACTPPPRRPPFLSLRPTLSRSRRRSARARLRTSPADRDRARRRAADIARYARCASRSESIADEAAVPGPSVFGRRSSPPLLRWLAIAGCLLSSDAAPPQRAPRITSDSSAGRPSHQGPR